MTLRATSVLFGAALLFGGLAAPPGNAQEVSLRVKAVHVMGLAGVKDNTKGTLNIENAQLHFVHGKANSDVSAAYVQDVVTGADSRESVGKTVGMMSMAAPYGGGRFLSLFRTKIDTLTIQYRDSNGGLHGAIFTMPAGAADRIKKDLVAQGAHTAGSGESARTAPTPNKERKQ